MDTIESTSQRIKQNGILAIIRGDFSVDDILQIGDALLAGTVTVSIIAAYFVNRASGSVIPAIIVHGLSNDSAGISGAATMELALSPYHQATKALPFALLAVGIVLLAGKSLGLARRRSV